MERFAKCSICGKVQCTGTIVQNENFRIFYNSSGNGETLTLSLSSALPAAPIVGALWLITGSDVAPRPFRVLSVTEAELGRTDPSGLVPVGGPPTDAATHAGSTARSSRPKEVGSR